MSGKNNRTLQAAQTAYLTVEQARRDMSAVPDWAAVQEELHAALRAVGHPAGQD